jgi:hypothetical protein
VRQERSRPLIVELEAWLREQRAKLSSNKRYDQGNQLLPQPLGRIYASLMTDGFACRTMPPSVGFGLSP